MTPRTIAVGLGLAGAVALWLPRAPAQGGAAQAPQRTARLSAPIDITGYWVAYVTEDWRFRMLTPPKGDYTRVPLNADGRKVADA